MKKYLVGGAVRDTLLGKNPNDKDYVVVGSTPEEMLAAGFSEVGAAFPVFLHPETKEEYALARKEKKTGVGHTSFEVEFGTNVTLKEDLSRRDLTINSIAMDENGNIFDPFCGTRDLVDKVLRHTSPAFQEDPLRVVRLARFYARFSDFTVADSTVALARKIVDSGEMDSLSNERYWAELDKVFDDGYGVFRFFAFLAEVGALEKVKFFKDVFGIVNARKVFTVWHPVVNALALRNYTSNAYRDYFVAMVSDESATLNGTATPLRITKLVNNLREMRKMKVASPENVFDFLNKNRGFASPAPEAFADLVQTMFMLTESTGETFSVKPVMLADCAAAGGCVDVTPFMHLSGKEIGASLAKARVEAVEKVFKEFK